MGKRGVSDDCEREACCRAVGEWVGILKSSRGSVNQGGFLSPQTAAPASDRLLLQTDGGTSCFALPRSQFECTWSGVM